MKKILMMLVLVMVMSTAVFADTPSGRISESVNLQVSLLNQNPDPVQPGRYVEVRFKAENFGLNKADDAVFELMPEYPFSLDPGVSARVEIGSIHGRAIDDESATVYYKLRVDSGAIEGDTDLKLKYSLDNGKTWVLLDSFTIRVQTLDAAVDVTSVESVPAKIEPGKSAKVYITLENQADSLMEDVAVKLDLTDDETPFVPINSISEKKVKLLESGDSAQFMFEVMAEGDAASQVYKVPITISYTDESGTSISKSDLLALIVGGEPDIQVGIDEQTVYQGGQAGDVSVKLVNKGVTDIKFLNLIIQPSDEYELFCCNKQYVGDLDSDDYELVDLKLFLKATEADMVKIPVTLEYADANNERFTEDVDLELKLYTSTQLKQFGIVKGNSAVGILIVIAVVVVGFIIYRRRKKKKQQNNNKK